MLCSLKSPKCCPFSGDRLLKHSLIGQRQQANEQRASQRRRDMVMELTIIPLGSGRSLSGAIADLVKIIEGSRLDYRMTAFGTLMASPAKNFLTNCWLMTATFRLLATPAAVNR